MDPEGGLPIPVPHQTHALPYTGAKKRLTTPLPSPLIAPDLIRINLPAGAPPPIGLSSSGHSQGPPGLHTPTAFISRAHPAAASAFEAVDSLMQRATTLWRDLAASPATRPYLGYFLAVLGACIGGAIFPLMDAYEEPVLMKVGSRNALIAAGCCYYVFRKEPEKNWVKKIVSQMHHRGSYLADPIVAPALLCGVTHALTSIFNQICLSQTGGEVAAVITNCSCVVAVLLSHLSGAAVSKTEQRAVGVVLLLVLYMLVAIQPPALGVLTGLGSSASNALYYVVQRRAGQIIPLAPLLALVYLLSAVSIIFSTLLLGQTTVTDWMASVFNLYYVIPTIVVAALTFAFQACLVMALKYSSPVVVTGAMSLEPLATWGIDWLVGNPLPDLHTLSILGCLMASTTTISYANSKPSSSRSASEGNVFHRQTSQRLAEDVP